MAAPDTHPLPKTAIPLPMDEIVAFCRRWKLTEFSVFGSVLTDRFGPDSDVDVLIDYRDDAALTLFNWAAMIEELEQIFGRRVDLIGRRGLQRGQAGERKRRILETARVVVHAA